jgi:hypothetical protein
MSSNLGYVQEAPNKETMLSGYHNRLCNLNGRQYDAVNQIANRVHEILNKRSPEPSSLQPAAGVKEMPPVDYAQKFEKELNSMSSNTERLEQIIYHLNEIV